MQYLWKMFFIDWNRKLLPKILRTCVPLNNSPLASRSKGYYNTVNGTIRSVIEGKELKP